MKITTNTQRNAAEFEALLRSGMDDLMLKTAAHQDAWGFGTEEQWLLDHGSAEVMFTFPEVVVSAPAQVIGVWETATGVWTWSWADSSLPEHLQVDAHRLRDYGTQHGFQHLINGSWAAEESHCWYMTALACWICDAKGAYRGVNGDTCTFITFRDVLRNSIPEPPREPLAHAFMASAAEEFKDCRSDPEEQREACCRYLRRGALEGIGQPELIHCLGLAAPSVLEMAGYSTDSAQNVMDLLKTISDDEIEHCGCLVQSPEAEPQS